MNSAYHQKNQFGFLYPSTIKGIGSPNDLMSFFAAIRLISNDPIEEFPHTHVLLRKPVVGRDMLHLFDEARLLQTRFQAAPVTEETLAALNLLGNETKLNIDAKTLAEVYSRIFFILVEDAPELVRIRMGKPETAILEKGSIRIGPIEPLIPSRFFQQLPASAFDDSDPPLWLRDEIFDEGFYVGKI